MRETHDDLARQHSNFSSKKTGPPSPTSSATHWGGDCRFCIGMERMITKVSGLVMAYDNEREGALVPHPRLEVSLPGAPDRI